MAETLAQIGFGTLLKLGNDASPQVFTTIAEVKSIGGFGFTLAEVEATHMESPGGYVERVAGLKDGDVLTAVCNFTTANSIALKVVWDAGLRRDFELNFPNTTAGNLPDYDFSAVPTGWHVNGINPGGVLEVEIAMRITGSITGA
jgi:hypothetical protein